MTTYNSYDSSRFRYNQRKVSRVNSMLSYDPWAYAINKKKKDGVFVGKVIFPEVDKPICDGWLRKAFKILFHRG